MKNKTNVLLSERFPEIAKEWNTNKNLSYSFDNFSQGSHKKVWWICSKGHEWQSTISNRIGLKRKCPYCTGQKVIKGVNDLATIYPNVVKEWNYDKNELNPYETAPGTHKKVWWICSKGHEWRAEVKSRVSGVGCPACNGKIVLKGFNDLETLNPDLSKEWHPTKNLPLKPSEITSASSKKVWWLCKNNHEYQAAVYNRKKGRGCPVCSKSIRSSFPEQAIYYYVKSQFPDAINGYRDIFPNTMELDVYIPSLKVGIEYDGKIYHSKQDVRLRDSRKYNICKQNEIVLIRIVEIKQYNPLLTCDHKIEIPNSEDYYLNYAINNLLHHLGRCMDIDVKRDRKEIISLLDIRKNSFFDEYPEISKEWDYEANFPLLPSNFAPHSNEKVSWICLKCGHKWQASIGDRTRKKATGCPRCKKRKNNDQLK